MTRPHDPNRTARAVALLALVSAFVLVLCGCGGGDPEDAPDQPTPSVSCQQGRCQ
jgi:hypothetical protein